ncbi:MAG: SAM-dependent methyltransferase [Bacteroidia bacterium]
MSNLSKGTLYLIPSLLGDSMVERSIPVFNMEVIQSLDEFIVEDIRSARRFLIKMKSKPIDSLTFHLLNEHTSPDKFRLCLDGLLKGRNAGLLSDAGCPGIADPGAEVVRLAHKHTIKVVPLIGPSSILLALISSGLNGQCFSFHGYLPKRQPERGNKIRQLEALVYKENQTQIFIETPYRNDALFQDILNTCRPETLLCLALDITLPAEYIHTMTVREWRAEKRNFNDHPAVFLIGR